MTRRPPRQAVLPPLLLALASCAGNLAPVEVGSSLPDDLASFDWSRAAPVEVGLESFAFEPASLTLERGRPVHLVLSNGSGIGHNFAAPSFFAASAVRDPDAARRLGENGGLVELDAGESMAIDLVPLEAGTFPLECTHFLHAGFGMTGRIEVQ